MAILSTALLVWLGFGFLFGVCFINRRDFNELFDNIWEQSIAQTRFEYPKNPKLFILVICTLGGLYITFGYLRNQLLNFLNR